MSNEELPGSIDMSAFEADFIDMAENVDVKERMQYLNDRIADCEDLDGFYKDLIKDSSTDLEKLKQLELAYKELLKRITDRYRPIDRQNADYRRDIATNERKLEQLRRERVRLEAEIEARKRARLERAFIDDSTKDALWRKDALPHQLEGAYRMFSAQRGLMGDKPGLGKTLQSIMAVDMLKAQGKAHKILIFTPKPVREDYKRAFERWSQEHFVTVLAQSLRGLKGEVLDVIAHLENAVVITNYEVWRKDKTIVDKLIACQFDTVIIDEAHNLKDSKSLAFRKIKEIVHASNKCFQCNKQVFSDRYCTHCGNQSIKRGDFRSVLNCFPMTGTPILNKPEELWALLNLIDDDAYPSVEAFLRDYCESRCINCDSVLRGCCLNPKKKFMFKKDGGAAALLAKLGMRYTMRTRDTAGVKMPPQEVKHHEFELDPERYPQQYAFTRRLMDKARLRLLGGEEITQTETLAWYTWIRQAAEWPDGIKLKDHSDCKRDMGEKCECPEIPYERVGQSILMDEAENILREARDSGERVVVFSHFKTALQEMERRLIHEGENPIKTIRFDGDLPDRIRVQAVDDFNLNYTKIGQHKYDVMLANYKTGSVGLNLTGAHRIITLGREWNPGKEEQAMDRLRRIDSQHKTAVDILHCEGTATELMDAMHAIKARTIAGFESEVSIREAMNDFLRKWGEDK